MVLVAIAGILFLIYVALGTGYDSRRHVAEAMQEALPVRDDVMEFRRKNGTWPQAQDATRLAAAAPRPEQARSIRYDPARRAVVVTMGHGPYEGKRFGFFGQDRDGKPEWTCHPIDLEPKYLPANCRN